MSASTIDGNGHANNVAYLQWMQDIAVEHYASIHGVEAQGENSTWVVREHKIEYLLPAFEGEEIEIQTWIADVRRVRSLRCYKFIRRSDASLLVRGGNKLGFCRYENRRSPRDPFVGRQRYAGPCG